MNQLPIEILFEILIGLPYRDIINYGLADANIFYTICQSDSFWRSKYEYDFEKIPGLNVDEDWKTIYEVRMKDLSLFEAGGEKYALIDNKGQLFRGYVSSIETPPEPHKFKEKFAYLSRSIGTVEDHWAVGGQGGYGTVLNDIGVVTVNGNAYILLDNEEFYNVTPPGKSVLKIKLNIRNNSEGDPFLIYFLIMNDYSVEYGIMDNLTHLLLNIDGKNKTKNLELSDPVRDIINRDEYTDHIHILTWNNRIHVYSLDSIQNESREDIWNLGDYFAMRTGLIPEIPRPAPRFPVLTPLLVYQRTITLSVIPQKIFQVGSDYVILSKGDMFIYNEESLRKMKISRKVKWIDLVPPFYLAVTEQGKLYILTHPDNTDKWYYRSEPEETCQTSLENLQNRCIIDEPFEINLTDKSNEKYNIIASHILSVTTHFSEPIYNQPSAANNQAQLTQKIDGLSLTENGKILKWDIEIETYID